MVGVFVFCTLVRHSVCTEHVHNIENGKGPRSCVVTCNQCQEPIPRQFWHGYQCEYPRTRLTWNGNAGMKLDQARALKSLTDETE
ncbi:hypothetical protein BJX99DRAFT_220841 [Aspergillus californicus]